MPRESFISKRKLEKSIRTQLSEIVDLLYKKSGEQDFAEFSGRFWENYDEDNICLVLKETAKALNDDRIYHRAEKLQQTFKDLKEAV